jgi:hypothetical protein
LYAYNYQMINFKSGVILAFFLFASLSLACGGANTNANAPVANSAANGPAANANSARTNVEELGLLINVPFQTDDVVWKEDAVNKRVIAIMLFSPEGARRIVAEGEQNGPPQNVSIAVENWFPAELTAQAEMSGDGALKGIAYPATQFHLAPYTAGRVTRIEGTDYFVLELSSK